jgi:tRNA (guanine-N7-)-methyltransferase
MSVVVCQEYRDNAARIQDAVNKLIMKPLRTIKSFVVRAGRMTPGQARAVDTYFPEFGRKFEDGAIDFAAWFGNDNPVILEIGFGMGHSLTQQATTNPHLNYVGIEVHQPGIGTLLKAMGVAGLQNLRVIQADAVDILQSCIADDALSGIQIYFPDPWHKKKHHKRRLIQPGFLSLLHAKLISGGFIHVATDWENYAEHIMEVASADNRFENTAGQGTFAERHGRPETKFERRGERLGHGVWDVYLQSSI